MVKGELYVDESESEIAVSEDSDKVISKLLILLLLVNF